VLFSALRSTRLSGEMLPTVSLIMSVMFELYYLVTFLLVRFAVKISWFESTKVTIMNSSLN